ncbi:Hypothetical predicted protein [Paramuricea clavata]|uniref:Uncharacterized protein n=1 Tax=Paramuricea clavata TaxID=317549 RepID=A0A6S7LTE4_PARCT|nr:Hypothetical predicted protein [Paramuricea clavata]
MNERFNQHSPGVTLEQVAIHDPDETEYRYVLGQNIYRKGRHSLKLKLEMFKDTFWMFVGILKENVVAQPDSMSHGWPGSYGWGLGKGGAKWENGVSTDENGLHDVLQGDVVKLVLDCDAANLSLLHLRTNQQFHIEIPKSQTWRLHVNLFNKDDKICLVNE